MKSLIFLAVVFCSTFDVAFAFDFLGFQTDRNPKSPKVVRKSKTLKSVTCPMEMLNLFFLLQRLSE